MARVLDRGTELAEVEALAHESTALLALVDGVHLATRTAGTAGAATGRDQQQNNHHQGGEQDSAHEPSPLNRDAASCPERVRERPHFHSFTGSIRSEAHHRGTVKNFPSPQASSTIP